MARSPHRPRGDWRSGKHTNSSVRGCATDLGDVDEPEWNPELAAHEILDLADIGPSRRGGFHGEIEVDEGQPQPTLGERVLEVEVDILVGPALGRHRVDETDLDTGKALRHGRHIVDDIGNAEVVAGLFPIGWTR